jgi:hypothetical protein
MSDLPTIRARFAGAFADEFGKWTARLPIAAVVAASSFLLNLPH